MKFYINVEINSLLIVVLNEISPHTRSRTGEHRYLRWSQERSTVGEIPPFAADGDDDEPRGRRAAAAISSDRSSYHRVAPPRRRGLQPWVVASPAGIGIADANGGLARPGPAVRASGVIAANCRTGTNVRRNRRLEERQEMIRRPAVVLVTAAVVLVNLADLLTRISHSLFIVRRTAPCTPIAGIRVSRFVDADGTNDSSHPTRDDRAPKLPRRPRSRAAREREIRSNDRRRAERAEADYEGQRMRRRRGGETRGGTQVEETRN